MCFLKNSIRLVIFSVLSTVTIQADIVRRAAIDVGSGETKLTIADVDTESNKTIKMYDQGYTVVGITNYSEVLEAICYTFDKQQ